MLPVCLRAWRKGKWVVAFPGPVASVGLEAACRVAFEEVWLRSAYALERLGVTLAAVGEREGAFRCPSDAERDRLHVWTVEEREVEAHEVRDRPVRRLLGFGALQEPHSFPRPPDSPRAQPEVARLAGGLPP